MTAVESALIEHKKSLKYFEENSLEIVDEIAARIITTFESGGTVFLCGNGGSAADAQHIAGEFVGRFKRERAPLPAVAMTTDTSVMTCIGNDYSYNDIFTRQVEALMKKGDILWAFSTSGASESILAAARAAKKKGSAIIGFTGKPESELERLSDFCLCSRTGYTGTAQEIHQLAYHIICEIIDRHYE